MKSHAQVEAPGGRPCPPLNVHTLVGNPGLQPGKSSQIMLPEVQVGIGLGTVHPLSVPCSMAMNFDPFMEASSEIQGQVWSLIPVDCIQAIGSWFLGGIWML